ncbi:MAG: prevent-host-death protein, partial [Sulfurimonadaceae bacterium]
IMTINANDVKTKGVSLFGNLLEKFDELIINVRGKDKFVVLDIQRYKELRANELDLAYIQTMQDIENKKYKTQTAKEHIQDLMNDL